MCTKRKCIHPCILQVQAGPLQVAAAKTNLWCAHVRMALHCWLVQVITPKEEGIVLDGMTIDSKGNLWIAHGEGGAIVCYNPSTGKEIQRV